MAVHRTLHVGAWCAVAAVAGALVASWRYAHAGAPLPGGLGPCVGPECPPTWPGIDNGVIEGRDAGINVFVGGNFSVIGGAAEAEGRIVVMGDMTVAKDGDATYNVGAVGVGFQVPPPEGSTFLAVRGNTTVEDGDTLTATKPDPNGASGDIRGVSNAARTGTVSGQEVVFGPEQAAETDPFVDLAGQLNVASQCYATAEPTGTVTFGEGNAFEFTGDGTSALQVFEVTGNLAAPGGFSAGIGFSGIPAGATVLVNITAPSPFLASLSFDAGGWEADALRLLWNIPSATAVALTGTAQFWGSTLVGALGSTAVVTESGVNGRFYAAGNLVHGAPGAPAGDEFHTLPFEGDLSDCVVPPTTTSTTTSTTLAVTTTTAATTTTALATTMTSAVAAVTSTTRPRVSCRRPERRRHGRHSGWPPSSSLRARSCSPCAGGRERVQLRE